MNNYYVVWAHNSRECISAPMQRKWAVEAAEHRRWLRPNQQYSIVGVRFKTLPTYSGVLQK